MEKKFERCMSDKKIWGICSGLARYFGMSATTMRIIFVVLFVFVGIGPLAYLILRFIMKPDEA